MTDNIAARDASGNTVTVAADELTIDGALSLVQRVKMVFGLAGAGVDVSATNPLPVQPVGPGTTAVTQVASSATSITLQAANTARRGLSIFNDSTATLYVKFGTTASATSYTVQVPAGGYYETPQPTYTGRIDGIWASANGNAYVTEAT